MTETGTAEVQIYARILTQTNAYLHTHTHTDSGECKNNETWVDKYGHGCDLYEDAPDASGTAVIHADEVKL